MSPEAQSVFKELERDVHRFQDTVGSWDTYDRETCAALEARAQEFCKFDVVRGSSILASLASVTGDLVNFERWVRNIERNGASEEAAHLRFMHSINHGYATNAQSCLPELAKRRGSVRLSDLLVGAYSAGAFLAALEAIEQANLRQEVLVMTTRIEELRITAAAVKALGLSDQEIGEMLNVAGEIVRENRLTWSSGRPNVVIIDANHEGPSISIDWRLFVSPKKAAELTWELTDRLVRREVDRAGCSVGFIGAQVDANSTL